MTITFLTKTWITGKNTMVITIPAGLRKFKNIKKDQFLQVTIHDGHREFTCSNLPSDNCINDSLNQKSDNKQTEKLYHLEDNDTGLEASDLKKNAKSKEGITQ